MRERRQSRVRSIAGAALVTLVALALPGCRLTQTNQITAGAWHACSLQADATVDCWGWNISGQLGDGTHVGHDTPAAVPGLSSVVDLDAGTSHTCVVLADGTARCWGDNTFGQLGDGAGGPDVDALAPVAVAGLTGLVEIEAANDFTCARRDDGTVWCWGRNLWAQLGDGTTSDRSTPVQVVGISTATAIAASGPACAVLSDRSIACWGPNIVPPTGVIDPPYHLEPVPIDGVGNVEHLATGLNHACAVLDDGTATCWGTNAVGEIGNGTTTPSRVAPTPVRGIGDLVGITAAGWHSCAIDASGASWCWGENDDGQLGDGTTTDWPSPHLVPGITGATAVTAYLNQTCVLLADSTSRCWGENDHGQLGDGGTLGKLVPTPVGWPNALAPIRDLSTGGRMTCVRQDDGVPRCWGGNYEGSVGDGTTRDRATATPVAGSPATLDIATGATHACAVLVSKDVTCWGTNAYGESGNGVTPPRTSPGVVAGVTGATQVEAGMWHSCAVLADRTARCWGANGSGALGNGTTSSGATPPVVVGGNQALGGIESMSLGWGHTCAVRDGSVWCWGSNNFLQSAGPTTTTPVPTPKAGLSQVTQVAAAEKHTCARSADGGVSCWGINSVGQLGRGTTGTPTAIPANVPGLGVASQIAVGSAHSCALVTGGTVWCWGDNGAGQLGDGTTTPRSSPVQVGGVSGAVSISAGANATCAVLADATARCWGANSWRQLGDGTVVDRHTPVTVEGFVTP